MSVRPYGDAFAARRYTARWHRVHDWATREIMGDISEPPSKVSRVALVRGQLVFDLADEEEAESRALELAEFPLRVGPDGRAGGRRRVVIRVFTWVVDLRQGVLYDPTWITTGRGFTARAAAASHNRWIRAYADSVDAGNESRRLVATAQEIAWWTAQTATPYV